MIRDRVAGWEPTRRDVLRIGAASTAAAAVGATVVATADVAVPAPAVPGVLDLYVNEGFVPMVDGSLVYMRGFGDRPSSVDDAAPSLTFATRVFLADDTLVEARFYPPGSAEPPKGRPAPHSLDPSGAGVHLVHRAHWGSFFPRRTIVAESGSRLRLRVHNGLRETHALAIQAAPGAAPVAHTGPVQQGSSGTIDIVAPAPGTYLICDPSREPVERVLGLYGALVVVPREDRWRLSAGGPEFERQWLWICHDVDPEWAALAQAGMTIDPGRTPLLPRYFTLNDRSGFQSLGISEDEAVNSAAHEDTLLSGSARRTDVRDFSRGTGATVVTGQLIRMVNAGVAAHQMHFHGNHVWTVRRNGVDFPRSAQAAFVDGVGHPVLQLWEDVVELEPRDTKEVMLPMKPPPDALEAVLAAQDCDWPFPMHCHAEPSQTAAGGLYPGGIVADWQLAVPMKPTGPGGSP